MSKVSCGKRFSLILKDDKTVWSCGHNAYGQLGDGTNVTKYNFVQVIKNDGTPLTNIIDICTSKDTSDLTQFGYSFCLALDSNGEVWSWGINGSGQLGLGNKVNTNKANKINGLTNVVQVAAGAGTSFALKADGSIWAWGSNNCYQFANGTTNDSLVPVRCKLNANNYITNAKEIFAGVNSVAYISTNNDLYTWGLGNSGILGDGNLNAHNVQYPELRASNVISFAFGYRHSVYSDSNNNSYGTGELMENSYINVTPTWVDNTAYSGGGYWSFPVSLGQSSTYKKIGSKSESAVTTITNMSTPTQLPLTNGVDVANVSKVGAGQDIASNGFVTYSMALCTMLLLDKTLRVMKIVTSASGIGLVNAYKGASSATVQTSANISIEQINIDNVNGNILGNVVSFSTGFDHGMAILLDGSVYAWGYNDFGQMGVGSTFNPSLGANYAKLVTGMTTTIPSVTITSPLSTTIYGINSPYNKVNLIGVLKDCKLGNVYRLKYKINNGTEYTIGSDWTCNGSNYNFSKNDITLTTEPEGINNITVNIYNITTGETFFGPTQSFLIDKTSPIVSNPIKWNNFINELGECIIEVGMNAIDPLSSGLSSGIPTSYCKTNLNGIDNASYRTPQFIRNDGTEYNTWQFNIGNSYNTLQSFKFKAIDNVGNVSNYSNVLSIYTLAHGPSNLTKSNITNNGVTLNWNRNGDPSNTTYIVKRQHGADIQEFNVGTNITFTDTNLLDGALYTYTITAYNGDNVATNSNNCIGYTEVTIDVVTANNTPIASNVYITGSVVIGDTLTGHYTYSDRNIEGNSIYKWYSSTDGITFNEIVGENNINYIVKDTDTGLYIKFEVTPVQIAEDQLVSPLSGNPIKSPMVGPIGVNPIAPTATIYSLKSISPDSCFYIGNTIEVKYKYHDDNSDIENGSNVNWYRGDTENGPWTLITSNNNTQQNTGYTYELSDDDFDKFIRVGIVPNNLVTPTTGAEVFSIIMLRIKYIPSSPEAVNLSIKKMVNDTLEENYSFIYPNDILYACYDYINSNKVPENNSEFRWYRSPINDPNGDYELILDIDGTPYNKKFYLIKEDDIGRAFDFEITPKSL